MFPPQLIVLLVALGISVALNLWQYHQHDTLVEKAATATQLSVNALDAGKQCNDSVETLARDSKAQGAQIALRLDKLAPLLSSYQKDAIKALSARPDNPQDLCGSLERFLKAKINAERKSP